MNAAYQKRCFVLQNGVLAWYSSGQTSEKIKRQNGCSVAADSRSRQTQARITRGAHASLPKPSLGPQPVGSNWHASLKLLEREALTGMPVRSYRLWSQSAPPMCTRAPATSACATSSAQAAVCSSPGPSAPPRWRPAALPCPPTPRPHYVSFRCLEYRRHNYRWGWTKGANRSFLYQVCARRCALPSAG